MQQTKKHITLSTLACQVSDALAQSVAKDVWVVGEISQISVGSAGHCYLNLVEREEGASAPKAEFRAAVWAAKYRMIESYFQSATGTSLASGMKVLLRVELNYHPVYGLSLVIQDIDPTYTVGETEREKRLTIDRLTGEGLMEMQREFALPLVAQRFAVVSSATAAGLEDFMKQIADSPYRIEIELFAATMQGENTERSLVDALRKIETRSREFDAVVIIRGGGSASDLRWFDNYNIAAAVARFPLPVLTGIGHEKDVSVTDMVAYHMFKTPTAVAAGLIDRIGSVYARFDGLQGNLISIAQGRLLAENGRIEKAASSMERLVNEVLRNADIRLERLKNSLHSSAKMVFERQSAVLEQYREKIPRTAIELLARKQSSLELLSEKIEGRNPRRILKMGYSIVTNIDGRSIKSISDAPKGTSLRVELSDGTIETEVIRSYHDL